MFKFTVVMVSLFSNTAMPRMHFWCYDKLSIGEHLQLGELEIKMPGMDYKVHDKNLEFTSLCQLTGTTPDRLLELCQEHHGTIIIHNHYESNKLKFRPFRALKMWSV